MTFDADIEIDQRLFEDGKVLIDEEGTVTEKKSSDERQIREFRSFLNDVTPEDFRGE